MNISYITHRFKQMERDYAGNNISLPKRIWYVIDYLFAALFQGASISDYFAYGFYKLRPSGRNEYITYRRFHKILHIANNPQDIHLCRNKIDFNNHFSDILGRNWLDLNTATMQDISAFVHKYPVFFIKDILGFRGDGVKRIESDKINIETFFKNKLSQSGTHYIVEEPLTELDTIQEFHPWSINTIRIVTLYDTTTDIVHFMNARIRIGNKHNNVDNFHYNGIGANIDVATGIIDSVGYDTHNNTYILHPITNKQILGFQIPQWSQCLSFIEGAARRLPSIRYIGWDLVIKKDGTLCLIEANDNADHDFQQLHNKGLWKEYKNFLKHLR